MSVPTTRTAIQRERVRLPAARTPRLALKPPPSSITPELVGSYRPRASELSRRIADRIGRDVAAFRDPRLGDLIREALDAAVTLFVDALAGAPVRGTAVAGLYRQLGRLEAQAGHPLDAMQAAHHIATQESWRDVRALAAELQLPPDAVEHLTSALLDFQQQLLDHALRGYAEPVPAPGPRPRLFTALLVGTDETALAQLARNEQWTIPELVAVGVARHGPDRGAVRAGDGVLVGAHDDALVLVGAPAAVRGCAENIATSQVPVAISWGVEPGSVPHALRWTRQALRLVDERRIEMPDDGIVWCEEHQAELCLHADPLLRRRTDEQVLAPLLGLAPKRRVVLAETLLVWLRTRHTAPAVAAELEVHVQTVRVRLKRLKLLFGDRLHDPAETVGLLTALESMTPRWRSESGVTRRHRSAVLEQSARRR